MGKALEGVLVLDLTTELWASLGAAMLGDFGARVVKLEIPEEVRRRRAAERAELGAEPFDHRSELVDRNKTSLGLDLAHPAAREILHGLVRRADVVVTDRPAAWLHEQGIDYAGAAALAPGLIYARGSGLGPAGPDADLPAIDELAAARTGMMEILPQPGQPPVYAGHGQTYTSVMLAFGVVTALLHRQETGLGQEVDVSLLAGNMYAASLDLQAFLAIGGERFLHPVSRLDAGNPMSGTLYPTADGLWVTLTMPETDRWWPALAEVTGLDAGDPRFASHDLRCGEGRLELMRLLDASFRKQPAAHWRRVFDERQMSADVIETYDYPTEDPQARRNRYILDLEHPSLGTVSLLGFPISMSDTPPRLDRMAPCLGQHSAEILRDLLDFPEDRIVDLEAEGVIA